MEANLNWIEDETKGEMRIIDATGDAKHMWDPDEPAEVEAARRMFNDLKKKGYAAFHVSKSGEPASKMAEFDPDARKMILVPQQVGG